jgi:phosphohistidine phosphatase
MARQLWLLRHAEAEPHGTRTDAERRLTKRGRQQARIAGVAVGRLRASFDVVLYSPRVRARATAELAAQAWSGAQRSRVFEHAPLAGGFDAEQALEAIGLAPAGGRVLLVGHEPDLSGVIAGLGGGRVDLKKGGLAALRLEGASAELVLLMRPRELALIAGDGATRARRALLVDGGVGGVPIYGQ